MRFISRLKGLMKKKKDVPALPEKSAPETSRAEDLKQLEEAIGALKELNELIGGGMKVQGLEDFLKSSGTGQVVPFTTIENYNDAKRELSHHTKMYEMMTDVDLIEELLSFHNKGYEIPGLVELYKKLERDEEITAVERKHLEQSYVLLGMELVYNV